MMQSSHEHDMRGVARAGNARVLLLAFLAAAVATALVSWVLVVMFGHKQEQRTPFVRVVEVNESFDRSGAVGPQLAASVRRLEVDGRRSVLRRQQRDAREQAGKASVAEAAVRRVCVQHRLSRGPRACVHAVRPGSDGARDSRSRRQGRVCTATDRRRCCIERLGLEALGEKADDETLAADFNMAAVKKGFEEVSTKTYAETLELLKQMPDGTPGENVPVFPQAPVGGFEGKIAGQPVPQGSSGRRRGPPGHLHRLPRSADDGDSRHAAGIHERDCGAGGERRAGAAFAEHRAVAARRSRAAVRSERRRQPAGDAVLRLRAVPRRILLREQDDADVPVEERAADGRRRADLGRNEVSGRQPVLRLRAWRDGREGFQGAAPGVRAVEPGRACTQRRELLRLPHAVRARGGDEGEQPPGAQPARESQRGLPELPPAERERTCRQRIDTIQERNLALMDTAAVAMTDMLDAILEAKAAGADEESLEKMFDLQRKAMWRLDFISSENSHGFHADQEAARILAESIDFSRQAQALALRSRSPEAPAIDDVPKQPVQGVTPSGPAPENGNEPVVPPVREGQT